MDGGSYRVPDNGSSFTPASSNCSFAELKPTSQYSRQTSNPNISVPYKQQQVSFFPYNNLQSNWRYHWPVYVDLLLIFFYYRLEFHLHPVAVGQNVHTRQSYLKLKGLRKALKKYRQSQNNEKIEPLRRIHGILKVFFCIKIIQLPLIVIT